MEIGETWSSHGASELEHCAQNTKNDNKCSAQRLAFTSVYILNEPECI